jgi:hypothetical protein
MAYKNFGLRFPSLDKILKDDDKNSSRVIDLRANQRLRVHQTETLACGPVQEPAPLAFRPQADAPGR